jgi:hypothetical protein
MTQSKSTFLQVIQCWFSVVVSELSPRNNVFNVLVLLCLFFFSLPILIHSNLNYTKPVVMYSAQKEEA